MCVLACWLVLGWGAAWAADVVKIGVVDYQQVLDKSEIGKSVIAEIETQGKKMQSSLREKEEEWKQLKEELDRKASLLRPEAREEKQRELKIREIDLKSLQKRYTDELRALQGKLMGELQKEVVAVITEMAKKEGYMLVLEKMEAGVMYAPDAFVLTDRIIQALNAKQTKDRGGKKQ